MACFMFFLYCIAEFTMTETKIFYIHDQGFIPAVLLMSGFFCTKIEFSNVVKCR